MLSRSSWLLLTILFDLILLVGVVQAQADSALYLPGIVQVEHTSADHVSVQRPLNSVSPLPFPQPMSHPSTTQGKLFRLCSAEVERVIGQRLAALIGCH
jgi:hypothetical protein